MYSKKIHVCMNFRDLVLVVICLTCLKNCLANCHQRVLIKGQYSAYGDVKVGVSQVVVLGLSSF